MPQPDNRCWHRSSPSRVGPSGAVQANSFAAAALIMLIRNSPSISTIASMAPSVRPVSFSWRSRSSSSTRTRRISASARFARSGTGRGAASRPAWAGRPRRRGGRGRAGRGRAAGRRGSDHARAGELRVAARVELDHAIRHVDHAPLAHRGPARGPADPVLEIIDPPVSEPERERAEPIPLLVVLGEPRRRCRAPAPGCGRAPARSFTCPRRCPRRRRGGRAPRRSDARR